MVERGDSIALLARRYNVPIQDLVELNGLQTPYRLEAGRTLVLPDSRVHVVRPGDTLSVLARNARIPTNELAKLNRLEPPYTLKVGQTLTVPGTGGNETTIPPHKPDPADNNPVHGVGAAAGSNHARIDTAALPPPAAITPPVPVPATPKRTGPVAAPLTPDQAKAAHSLAALPPAHRPAVPAAMTPASVATPAATPAATAAAVPPPRGGARLIWPVKGKVLSDYGDKPDGRHNDGVNIAAAKGTPVMVADNGVVAYVGNELKGYGNLLLIRHRGGLITAYAHLDHSLVQRGATVKRGQKIGTVGATGSVTSPQLHFEVRKGSDAVDPGDFLEEVKEPN